MRNAPTRLAKLALISFAVVLLTPFVFAQHYQQTNLVSNTGLPNTTPDPNLQNPWGLVASPKSPWWVSDNANGLSTLYTGAGQIIPINGNGKVIVHAADPQGTGSPSGIVFNGSPTDFMLNGKAAAFIFVTEDGTVSAWNGGTAATLIVNNSQKPTPANGAVYKGATIVEVNGKRFLLAANFRSGRIDVFDTTFTQVPSSEERFDDDRLPAGFAPFNVQAIGPNVYISYAKQTADKHDPVSGTGLGFVDVFSRSGRLLQRLQHGPWFNAPWGLTLAPGNFGEFSHALLVGQFRGGTVSAFNPVTGAFLGTMLNPDGSVVTIDGLWALEFGNDASAGPSTTLFFTAGPNSETDGIFGTLTPTAAELSEADEL